MLSKGQRTAILELHAQGVPKRQIARVLKVSRLTVRTVVKSESSDVPALIRPEKAEPHRQQILELLATCKGNLVRVHEELVRSGADVSYQALTRTSHAGREKCGSSSQTHSRKRSDGFCDGEGAFSGAN